MGSCDIDISFQYVVRKKAFYRRVHALMNVIRKKRDDGNAERFKLICFYKGMIIAYRQHKITTDALMHECLEFLKSVDMVGVDGPHSGSDLLNISLAEKEFIEQHVFPEILDTDPFALNREYKEHFGRLRLTGLRQNSVPLPDID